MKLIDDWRRAWRFFSVKLQGGVVALAAGWAVMPQEWKDAVPKWVLVACAGAFAIATIGGRVVQQKEPR